MRVSLGISYYGSKAKHLDFILPLLPMTPRYVEPFGGSAAVLLNRPRSEEEVYNDLYRPLVRTVLAVRDELEELVRLVSLTPYSRSEFEMTYEKRTKEVRLRELDGGTDLETARRIVMRSHQSVSGFAASNESAGGWSRCLANGGSAGVPGRFGRFGRCVREASERLQGVAVENRDAIDVLTEYDSPDTLTYLDPPYAKDTRKDTDGYAKDMSDDGQRRLADALESIEGLAAVSGYESDLYEELYPASKGWVKHVGASTTTTVNPRLKSRVRTEVLWTNYGD